MSRFICIHGHFYQPPRENAWLETIELQPSALPSHDWNERITAECYRPNAAARILDDQGRILEFINVYEHISFNFGPTLLSWMHEHASDVHDAVVEADRRSRHRFSGHGSAIAQAYNHLIMPLANPRDRRTQVAWGIRDFEHRFDRRPEGLWLPETAVDVDTLEALAEHGIAFTILAPHQLAPLNGEEAGDHSEATIDPRRPYRIDLPSGRSIAAFPYDGELAQAVAFEKLLNSGSSFADRLMEALPNGERDIPPLVHIATDGETYGHHHRFGEMALAYALRAIDAREDIHLTNYGEYLERFPPTQRARLVERTAWSCAHGIERWKGDCGCASGAHPEWNQRWRTPLREALDSLRDDADGLFQAEGSHLFTDPWKARDDFIDVVIDRTEQSIKRFLTAHAREGLTVMLHNKALALMEMQRHAMLMFTSCGWFFDDVSGIETRQILQYAARVVELCRDTAGVDLSENLLNRLEEAVSNLPEKGTGRDVCRRMIETGEQSLPAVIARRALQDMKESDAEADDFFFGHDINVLRHDHCPVPDGTVHHAIAVVSSRTTRMTRTVEYVGFMLRDEIGCAHRVIDDPDSSSDESLSALVQDIRDRGAPAILEPSDRFRPLLMRLPDMPAEVRWWYLNERRSQLLDAIHGDLPVDGSELARLHALAIGLGVPTPQVLLNRLQSHVNLAVREGLRTAPPELHQLAERLERANSLLVPLDPQLLQSDVSRFASAMIKRLLDDSMEVDELRLLAVIGCDLVSMLQWTELSALHDACLHRLNRIASPPDAHHPDAHHDERVAIQQILDALGLLPPTDATE